MNKSTRDARVELLRIFGILMILGYHNMQVDWVLEGSYHFSIDYVTGFFSDCVPMFFMILGFYLFQNNSYKKLLIRTIKKIIFPTLLLFAAYFYLYDWIINGQSFRESISHSLDDYVYITRNLLMLRSPYTYTNHTWYLFLYIAVIALFPLMNSFVEYLDQNIQREKIFLISTLALFIVNDFFDNEFLSFSFITTGGIIPALVMVIWGHILYRHRNMFIHKGFALLSQIGFLLANLLRTFTVYHRIAPDGTWHTSIKAWFSCFGLICPTLLIIFAFNVIDNKKNSKVNDVICAIAKINLPMYLLHQICLDYLTVSGFRQISAEFAYSHFLEVIGNFVVVAIDTFASFILTFLLVFIVLTIKKLLCHIYSKIKSAVTQRT